MSFILIVASFVLLAAGEGTVRAADPIKIGFMAPYVGTWSKFGGDLRDGFKLALEEAGYKVAGRQIIFIDEESLLKVF
jgi:branched-chain amino acid transport system substrate-binding protein